MAKRKQLWHPKEVRKKIQVSQLINRLTKHALSDEPIMNASQVKAAQGLIDKVVPSLSSVTLGGDADKPIVTMEISGSEKLKQYIDGIAKRS